MRKYLLALSVACAVTASALSAQIEFGFGPGPRALDNLTVFDAPAGSVEARAWSALRPQVRVLAMNPTFLMRTEMQQGHPYPPRASAAMYLSDRDLAGLAQIIRRDGFALSYAAGIGLSGAVCTMSWRDAGRVAAQAEYDEIASRLRDAGIAVTRIDADGVLLRLVTGSRKPHGCNAQKAGQGFSPDFAAYIAHDYLRSLRDLIARGQADFAPGSGVPAVDMVVNLPNWPVLGRHAIGPARTSPVRPPDLMDVLAAFAARQQYDFDNGVPHERRLHIARTILDYPYAHMRGDEAAFIGKLTNLWVAMKAMNPGDDRPGLGVIANTVSHVHECLNQAPAHREMPFLAYGADRNRDGALGASEMVPTACIARQIGADTAGNAADGVLDNDVDFYRESFAFADAVQPGGRIYRQLHPALRDDIEAIYFMSWGINPVTNLGYMQAVSRYLRSR